MKLRCCLHEKRIKRCGKIRRALFTSVPIRSSPQITHVAHAYETFNFSNVHENVSLACLTCNIEYLSTHRLFIVVCSILLKRITNNEISNAFNSNCKSLHGKKLALILLHCSLYDTTTEMLRSTTGN